MYGRAMLTACCQRRHSIPARVEWVHGEGIGEGRAVQVPGALRARGARRVCDPAEEIALEGGEHLRHAELLACAPRNAGVRLGRAGRVLRGGRWRGLRSRFAGLAGWRARGCLLFMLRGQLFAGGAPRDARLFCKKSWALEKVGLGQTKFQNLPLGPIG